MDALNEHKFAKNGYCLVENAISLELRDFVTQYALFDEMQNFNGNGDGQTPNAHFRYADPAMESLLIHLHKTMEENTGLLLFPTYSYHRVYRPGDELKEHRDRPSCEISATICFNYSYDDSKFSWPIFMNNYEAVQKPGDMIIYRGCDLPHWRNKFNIEEDVWQVQGFFHYVDANGPHAEWKFDKRNSIGEKDLRKPSSIKPYIQFV
jgi:hypothetical protein